MKKHNVGRNKKFILSIVIINIVLLVVAYFISIKMYHLTSPKLYFGELGVCPYIGIFFICISPCIYTLGGIIGLEEDEVKKLTLRRRIAHIVSIVSIVILESISVVSMLFLAVVIPPLKDYTNNVKDYLVVNEDIGKCAPIYEKFFPTQIPAEAIDIEYVYEAYSALLVSEGKIEASWILPLNEYENSKADMENIAYMEEVGEGTYNIYLLNCAYPNNFKLQFKCDDQTRRMTYSMSIED